MQRTILCVAMLAVACGAPPPKENNGSTNNATNSATNNTSGTNLATNGSTSCTFDADCSSGEACEAQVCVDVCTGDPDCPGGMVCIEGMNTTARVCRVDSRNNGTNGQTNNGTPNNSTNTNNETALLIVQIADTSTGDGSCDVADPGSDIFGVALENEVGEAIGWGSVVWDSIEIEGNDYSGTANLSGTPPSLNADSCPDDFSSDTITSLGCGGWIAVEFVGPDDNPVPLVAGSGQAIRVYEYGGQCLTGGANDTYNLNVCTDTQDILAGSDASCTVPLAADASAEFVGLVDF